jgi:NAD(P)-dependent dehydrogenase (short-subunit alcohol dehydrogenase family)
MTRRRDKVAIITGAAGGTGKAAAQLFAKEGARIVADPARSAHQERRGVACR